VNGSHHPDNTAPPTKTPASAERFALWAPASLFVLVALIHLHQNWTANLNPWFGGGFGMFSTTDRPWPQSLSLEAEDAAGKRYLVEWIPEWSDHTERDKLGAQPNAKALSVTAGYALNSRRSPNAGAVRQLLVTLDKAKLLDRLTLREDAATLSKIEVVRAQSSDDASSDLGLVHARARAWRLGFDTKSARFRTEAIGEPGEASRQP